MNEHDLELYRRLIAERDEKIAQLQVAADPAMLEALEECAADLEAEIKANYPARIRVPSQEQRYQNDMAPVLRARAIIARAKGEM